MQPRIEISIPGQKLRLRRGLRVERVWAVSTAANGPGTLENSHCTPTGRFRIAEKFGAGEPAWAEFRSRKPTGEIAAPGGAADRILTRILWLDGLDPDNANTHSRYIYIHGTNQEDQIGKPVSHGCIRMRNADVAALFDLVEVGTPVRIRA